MDTLSYLILRIAIAISFLGHGLVRLPKLNAFSQWMTESFEKTMLPKVAIVPFSYALPIAEFAIGLLLLTGFLTKPAAFTGALLMLMLLLGTAIIENWEAIPSQLLHIIFLAFLLQFMDSNSYALDKIFYK